MSGTGKKDGTPPGKPPVPMTVEALWTVGDVATFLQVSKDWVYRRAASGDLPSRKVGSHLRFVRVEVITWLDAQKRPD